MKYTDLSINLGFYKNMQETNWLKLFPQWWSETDPLLEAIGQEIAYIKAESIFALLNISFKPPVMIWQNSINHENYEESFSLTTLPEQLKLPAPLYKSFGTITLNNSTIEDIKNLKISLNNTDYITIKDTIITDDIVNINVGSSTVYINDKKANIKKYGDGLSSFKTGINNEEYQKGTPLHNEAINLFFEADNSNVDIEATVIFDNVVFINEQNIEVNGSELIPIEKIELYAYYDFPYNQISTGLRKVYEKEYDPKTNVVYDMITTHFYTKKFYVHVYYKGIDFPYKVGFPCTKDAKSDSIYHVNTNLDEWGVYFGLPRREYRENISDEDYPFTFPQYYPFDIEQDFWYYSRLVNEYAWNDLAINDVDLMDIDDNPVIRLHSIDPFIQDFVVEAKSIYAEEKEGIDYSKYTPMQITQESPEADYKRMTYFDIQNLLKYDNNKAYVTLANKKNLAINAQKYKSNKLITSFNLDDLPEDINIDDIQVLIEAESTDNTKTKYSNNETGIIIPAIGEDILIPMTQSSDYELEEKEIVYNLTDGIDKIKKMYDNVDKNILQHAIIKPFGGKQGSYISIPFILKENDDIIDDITEIYVTYNNTDTYKAEYHKTDDERFIYVYLPKYITEANYKQQTITKETGLSKNDENEVYHKEISMNIACKSKDHASFVGTNIQMILRTNTDTYIDNSEEQEIAKELVQSVELYGPYTDNKIQNQYITNEWHTSDLRNMLQTDSIYFVNVFENEDETNTPTILIKNITLKISHSPKKSDFKIKTGIIKDNIEKPNIAKLMVQIENIGTKPLKTNVDIISATNLKLDTSYIDVDLNIGGGLTEYINIQPEYPILDGEYEILTLCEDKILKNTLLVYGEGLIQTNVIVKQHYGQYNEEIPLIAKVGNVSKIDIDDHVSKITFYVDGYKVAEGFVANNMVQTKFNPKDFKLTSGIHNLEARYSGNTKFASSRANTLLLISQDPIDIDINAQQQVKYKDANGYTINAIITSNNVPITEGTVIFYIDEEEIGRTNLDEYGNATIIDTNIDYKPGKHTLTVKYSGTNQYISADKSMEIEIIGGETIIDVFNINAKPCDKVIIKARITNVNNQIIKHGHVTFTILNTVSELIKVENGYCTYEYTIPEEVSEEEITVQVNYIDDEYDIYQSGQGVSTIIVKKHPVIIKSYDYFYAYQYEPIGFYLQLEDAITHEPITDGSITINIPEQRITIEDHPIDSDGIARIVYRPVDFTAKEFNQLLKFKFKTNELLSQDELPSDDDTNNIENLYRIYSGDLNDLDLMDFVLNDNHLFYNLARKGEEAQVEEVFIGADGYLYARTSIDSIRNYLTGGCNLEITYNPTPAYEEQTKNAIINFKKGSVDIDLLEYNLRYDVQEDNINCYVTKYNLDDNEYNTNVGDGIVHFYIDQQKIGEAIPLDGVAAIPITSLQDIKAGRHLLSTEYIPKDRYKENTQTFSILNLNPITSNINLDFDRIFDGEKSKLTVLLTADNNDIDLTGILDVYIDGEKIYSINILGSENIIGNVSWDRIKDLYDLDYEKAGYKFIFDIDIPNDLDDKEHTITVEYSGNNYISSASTTKTLEVEQVDLDLSAKDITVAQGKKAIIKAIVSSPVQDFVNEGTIILQQGNDNIIAKEYVHNNIASLEFTAPNEVGSHAYTIKFLETSHYKEATTASSITVNVIKAQDIVYISHEEEYDQQQIQQEEQEEQEQQEEQEEQIQQEQLSEIVVQTFEEAQQCVKENGTIFIRDYVSLYNNIDITENITITGVNDCVIQKDSIPLLQDNILPIYHFTDFEDTLYKIKDLTIDYITTIDFQIINSQLYLLRNNQQIPIFLLEDGFFYTQTSGILAETISNININIKGDTNVNIDNITFNTNDNINKYDLIINNDGILNITKTILNDNVYIKNKNNITINQSLVYCKLLGITNNDNLDNNWWGSNKSPYNTNNHIILTIDSNNDPAIIGEDITIQAHLIGANNSYYDLPAPHFKFTSETGYFSIDSGYFVENTAYTTYIDGIKEEQVYCLVDNEKAGIQIYDYDHKTEIILDPATEIPVGYQIPFRVKVQSCADTFYKFDANNNIIKQSNNINDGYVLFTLNNKKIGQAKVINGEATLPIYLSKNVYEADTILKLEAHYVSESDYFDSYADKNITLIDDSNVCYVSTSGNNTNTGTFDAPVSSILQAIMLNKDTIYIKEGIYEDNNINVIGTQHIKKYNYDVIFKNNDESIFNSSDEESTLIIEGLTFENNNAPIIKNINNVTCTQCTFYNNQSEYLIQPNMSATIQYSAIVNNNKIFDEHNNGCQLPYNWYGSNDISDIPEYYYINDYLYMTVETTKDVIYLGSVAKVTAKLKHYKLNDDPTLMYELEEPIPLRIALFDTDVGSFMPIKDYTYNNMATSFLNTNDLTNTDHIILELPDNTNYIEKSVTLKCYVHDLFDNVINEGTVIFELNDEKYNVDVKNGVAELKMFISLFAGEYDLICTYVGNQSVAKASQTFIVQKPEIKVEEISIDPHDHIYQTILDASFIDTFNNKISKQTVSIYIDQNFIKEDTILDGKLNSTLSYPELSLGQHILKITTDDNQENYEPFTYTYIFYANQKETSILFDYETLPLSTEDDYVYSDLIINVIDKDKKYIQSGYVEVFFDNKPIYINDNSQFTLEENETKIYLQNGLAVIYDFYCLEQGSHSIMIHYTDDNNKYKEIVYDKSIQVATEEVVIASDILYNQLEVEVSKPLKFNFPIRNKSNKPIKRGTVSLTLLGHSVLAENLQIQNNGYVIYNEQLPVNTKPTKYNLEIQYTDSTKKYENKTEVFNFTVKPITTQIIVNQVEASPNEIKTIDYEVTSYYGSVFEGDLIAYYNGNEIGRQSISDLNNTMNLNIPFLSEGTYKIKFVYHSNVGNYADAEVTTDLIINPINVNIDIDPIQYYPNQDFDLTVLIKDENSNDKVDMGTTTLYIDNVKYDTANVVNGEAIYHLSFNQIKTYQLRVIYEENEYYMQTSKDQMFSTNRIPINDINIDIMPSLPNQVFETIVTIQAPFNVTDGILTFYINNDILNSYMVTEEEEQYVKLHIPNLSAGTYDLQIEYNNSQIFENKKVYKTFVIEPQDLNIILNVPNEVSLNDIIDIQTTQLPTNVNGTIEYYLSSTENETNRFIKMVHTNNQSEINFKYELPYLNKTQYYIIAKYIGDEYYNEKIISKPITINKSDINLSTIEIDPIQYQNELYIYADINNLYFNEKVYFDIKYEDEYENIGYVEANEGIIDFKKQIDSKYIVGNYQIKIRSSETTIYNNAEFVTQLSIIQATPILKENTIEEYIGNKLNIDNIVFADKYDNILSGTIDNIDYTVTNEDDISIKFTPNNTNFSEKTEDIHIIPLLNKVEWTLNAPNTVTRTKEVKCIFDVSVTTSDIPIDEEDISFVLSDDTQDIEIEDISSFIIPKTFNDNDYYYLTISFEKENFESKQETYKLRNSNEKVIEVTNNLADALHLINDYGTIKLTEDITSTTECVNDKNVKIIGNNHKVSNNIINNGSLVIDNVIFEDCAKTPIYTNNQLIVSNCEFNNNSSCDITKGGAIYINNKNKNTIIQYCTFNNNKASLYGGAIFSEKGNDVIIQYNTFTQNGCINTSGSSISVNGKMYIAQNKFYKNIGQSEIHILNGDVSIENNYFDGSLTYDIDNHMGGNVKCDLNYFGYNDYESIKNKMTDNVTINNWLRSFYDLEYTQPINSAVLAKITPRINKYQIKTEKEITDIETNFGKIPLENNTKLNKTFTIEKDTLPYTLIIGQEQHIIGDKDDNTEN